MTWWGRQYRASHYRERRHGPAEPETQSMHANSLHGNREVPGVADQSLRSARSRKTCGHNLDMHVTGKSDGGLVSMKRANKGAQPVYTGQPPAEFVEKRPPAKGNSGQATVTGTQRLEATSSVQFGVREDVSFLCVRPEAGARCGSSARRDRRGGWRVTAFPTATTNFKFEICRPQRPSQFG